ncbi:MAG TPA: hypothetical protein VN702_07160 [Acetobacteraceae bacterium]|nr:hypothetical protein [Acetobacteraceae bacterium]
MAGNPSNKAMEEEFDVLMRRAGLIIPPARRSGILASYADLLEQIALLHGRYGHEAEPANVYRVPPIGPGQ